MSNANITAANAFITQANAAGADVLAGGVQVNATLRHEEHLMYDQELIMVARERLNGIADLRAMGLVMNLGGLGTMLSMYERSGDMTAAAINMDAVTPSEKDRVSFDQVGVPIPIISKDWSLNKRQLEASRKRGEALSTTQVGIASRIVYDTLEDSLFNGMADLQFDNRSVYGYCTHPQRNTVTLSGTGWANVAGRDIIGDTKNMIAAMYAANRFGPFTMYVAKDIWAEIQMDYNDEKGDKTFKERIEAFADISMVKAGDSLKDGNIVLVELKRDVVDLGLGQDIRNLEWQTDPMQSQFKVYMAAAPRVKADKNGSCGIVHATPA